MNILRVSLVSVFVLLAGCAQQAVRNPSEYKLNATLYMQTAAEYRALCYQAYNVARRVLDEDLARKRPGKRAIVVDIDETVLDNSRHQGRLIKTAALYTSASWQEWEKVVDASAIPGSVEFLNYAVSKGARVFYVTSRKDVTRAETIANLKKVGLPLQDETSLMTRQSGDSSKEGRRQAIEKLGYRIVLLAGDNLGDHSDQFDSKTSDERLSAADRLRAEWGKRFIVLPNPIYGDWEQSLYGKFDPKQTEEEREAIRLKALRDF